MKESRGGEYVGGFEVVEVEGFSTIFSTTDLSPWLLKLFLSSLERYSSSFSFPLFFSFFNNLLGAI